MQLNGNMPVHKKDWQPGILRITGSIPSGTPGWGIVQLRFGYTWKFVSFQSGIENIFDQSYRTHGSGIDGYGRTGWIRMTFSF